MFCRSYSAMGMVAAGTSCRFTNGPKQRASRPGRDALISELFRVFVFFSSSLCVRCLPDRSARPCIDFSLSREPHRVENRGKRPVITIVGGLRSDADEIDQTLRTQHRDDPIRFLTAGRRNIAQIGRKPRLAVQAQALALP